MTRKTTQPRVTGADGKRRHPLLELVKSQSISGLARYLGHANHTTVNIYVSRARENRGTLVPPEWVLPLCQLTGWRPYNFRPDLYLPGWEMPGEPAGASNEHAA